MLLPCVLKSRFIEERSASGDIACGDRHDGAGGGAVRGTGEVIRAGRRVRPHRRVVGEVVAAPGGAAPVISRRGVKERLVDVGVNAGVPGISSTSQAATRSMAARRPGAS